MNKQIQKLEQLHQLVNNEVNGPKLISFIEKSVGTLIGYDVNEHIYQDDNCFNITNNTERDFFIYCIGNNDFDAFINEFNEEGTTESDWDNFTQNILNHITK